MRTTLLLAATGLLLAADAKDDQVQKELKKFEGTWTLVSGEKDGTKLAEDVVKKSKITWKGKECVIDSPHQSKDPIKATASVDPTKKPGEMEWIRSTGPDAGKKMLALYEWVGDDQYRIVFALAGGDRPKEFATKAGSKHIMHVWKRAKE